MITKSAANADLRSKSGKPRGTSGGGSPKMMGAGGTLPMKDMPRNTNGDGLGVLQPKGQRPPKGGGSPKIMNESIDILSPKDQRPPRGGGSPKIAAVLNWFGNDSIRQAGPHPNQKPDQKLSLIHTALLCYQQALAHDPNDPGLMVNLAMAKLLAGDTPGAEMQFVNAYKQSQQDINKLFALLSLKYDHNKFAEETQLSAVEKKLRTTIKKCVEKTGTPTPQPPNQSILGEGIPTDPQGMTTEEVKEFLYIKTIDGEKE